MGDTVQNQANRIKHRCLSFDQYITGCDGGKGIQFSVQKIVRHPDILHKYARHGPVCISFLHEHVVILKIEVDGWAVRHYFHKHPAVGDMGCNGFCDRIQPSQFFYCKCGGIQR